MVVELAGMVVELAGMVVELVGMVVELVGKLRVHAVGETLCGAYGMR